ncbi:tyrosine-protein phosphatase [Vallitalea okinawensis]|uniref:tyrosine-protein phosphatase n=1 Tax=Vallitalea okinawensis TaxID=2078660 RepID=UPI000CFD8D1C|nr:CpsB/CapC family capsule biosynthesis tyrosine phosphatase [Vallitalea okinawensis]
MVDIHSHILYGIDDGARSSEDTLKMLRIAEQEGIKAIIATPHYIQGYNSYNAKDLVERYEEVKELIAEHKIDIAIYLGNELSIDYKLVKALEDDEAKTLADSNYVLLEFPFSSWSDQFENILFNLSVKGYKIIIAHVERYGQIEKDMNLVREWIEKGYYIQVNAGSLTGLSGSKVQERAITLVQHDMVHFVATDSHSPLKRAPFIQKAYNMLCDLVGEEKANTLCYTNAMAVINNGVISDVQPKAIRPKNLVQRFMAYCGSIF